MASEDDSTTSAGDAPQTPPPATSFPRGGAGPPQPLPKGAHVGLVLVSMLVLGIMFAIMGWAFL